MSSKLFHLGGGGEMHMMRQQSTMKELLRPIDDYLRLFALSARKRDAYDKGHDSGPRWSKIRRFYCRFVHFYLWIYLIRSIVAPFIEPAELSALILGDMSGLANDESGKRFFFLIAVYGFGTHAAFVAGHFYKSEKSISWLETFGQLWYETAFRVGWSNNNSNNTYASINRKHITWKKRLGIMSWTVMAVNLGIFAYTNIYAAYIHPEVNFLYFVPWAVATTWWIFFSTGIALASVSFFFITCLSIQQRFEEVTADMELLAADLKSSTQAHIPSLAQLQAKHYRACEMVHEANRFWRSFVFYTFLVHIPFSCFCIYQLIFAPVDPITRFHLGWCGFVALVLLGMVSFIAANVATEAHRPYTLLYTMSLNNLPTEMRIQIGTFLQRLGGPTIGLMCLDLFVVTNGKISSVCTAVLSYFFIIVDFNKGTTDGSTPEEEEAALAAAAAASGCDPIEAITESLLGGGGKQLENLGLEPKQ